MVISDDRCTREEEFEGKVTVITYFSHLQGYKMHEHGNISHLRNKIKQTKNNSHKN